MPDDRTNSIERSFFKALSAFILTPIVAAGLWLPLVHVFGAAAGPWGHMAGGAEPPRSPDPAERYGGNYSIAWVDVSPTPIHPGWSGASSQDSEPSLFP